jgi:hypothetical protein
MVAHIVLGCLILRFNPYHIRAPYAMTVLTISTIPTVAQTTASILTRPTHISMDGRPQHSHKDTSQTQYHKGWKDLYDSQGCMVKHN